MAFLNSINRKKRIVEILLSTLGVILVLIILWIGLNTTIKDDGNRYLTIKIKYQSDADSILQANNNYVLELAYKLDTTTNQNIGFSQDYDKQLTLTALLKSFNISNEEYHKFFEKKEDEEYEKWTEELKEFNKKNTKLLDSLKENIK